MDVAVINHQLSDLRTLQSAIAAAHEAMLDNLGKWLRVKKQKAEIVAAESRTKICERARWSEAPRTPLTNPPPRQIILLHGAKHSLRWKVSLKGAKIKDFASLSIVLEVNDLPNEKVRRESPRPALCRQVRAGVNYPV